MDYISSYIHVSCVLLGWEPGTQYVYKYVGRSANGIYKLKMQHAVIELHSRVIVQTSEHRREHHRRESNIISRVMR